LRANSGATDRLDALVPAGELEGECPPCEPLEQTTR